MGSIITTLFCDNRLKGTGSYNSVIYTGNTMKILLFARSGHPPVPHCQDLGGPTVYIQKLHGHFQVSTLLYLYLQKQNLLRNRSRQSEIISGVSRIIILRSCTEDIQMFGYFRYFLIQKHQLEIPSFIHQFTIK